MKYELFLLKLCFPPSKSILIQISDYLLYVGLKWIQLLNKESVIFTDEYVHL